MPPSGRQIELVAGDSRAVVVEVGGGLRTLRLGGREVVDGFAEDVRAGGGRGQHLLPWPNRVGDGRWSWQGQDHQLPLSEPDTHNASHGLVRWAAWQLAELTPTTAVLRTVVTPQPGWPGRLDVTCAWRLEPDGLSAELTVVSRSDRPLPFGYGAHPYLTPGLAGLVDDEVLHVPASRRLVVDDRGLPVQVQDVAATPYDFRIPRAVGDTLLDTCFGGLERRADGSAGVRFGSTEVWGDASFSWFQVFSGDTLPADQRRRGLAIEPMTCPPDALRTGTDLVVLELGAPWSATWGIRTV